MRLWWMPAILLCVGICAPSFSQASPAGEASGSAQIGSAQKRAETPGELPTPEGLERLFELPSDRKYTIERRGGRTMGEWKLAFRELSTALSDEQRALAEAEARLDEIASSTSPWQVGPALPGIQSSEAPLDFQLRQRMKQHKAEIERLERRLRELRVEADLAGVPDDWRT